MMSRAGMRAFDRASGIVEPDRLVDIGFDRRYLNLDCLPMP
jgi:hypothetical protein